MPNLLELAVEHHRAGRLDEAGSLYRQALEIEPGNADVLHLLGALDQQQGRNESAVARIEKAHGIRAPNAMTLNNLGKAYFGLKRLQEARRCFDQSLALKPDHAEAHGNLGAALAELGELPEAARSLRRAVALQPEHSYAHFNLGNALRELGDGGAAEASYRRAIALDPRMAQAHVNLGDLLRERGEFGEAEACYRKALELDPRLPGAYAGLGTALRALQRPEEAEICYRKALHAGASSKYVRHGLGNVLYDRGRLEEAEQVFRETLERDPDFAQARWSLALSRVLSFARAGQDADAMREVRELDAWLRSRALDDPGALVGSLQPFYLAYLETDHRELLREYGALCARLMQLCQGNAGEPKRPARAAGGAVRLGIVSAHVHDHSVWNAIVRGWVRHLDRGRVELSIFHLGRLRDAETALARGAAHFEEGPRTLRQWVEAIRARSLDALVYPEIGMDATTLQLAALRLAPLQLAAWGHPQTTGLPTVDAYLSAQSFEPGNAQESYTEQLVALPNLGCCYEPRALESVELDPAEAGVEPGTALLLCAGTPYKYAPEHDWIWPEIVRRASGPCKLAFFALEPAPMFDALRSRLQAAFARAGMDCARSVVFLPPLRPAVFHGLMRRADALLDTVGFSGFNTAMQAVECGLPIVAYEGKHMRGRFASGIMRRMGMTDWVATTAEEFVALAARIAGDAGQRKEARARIEAVRGALFGDLAPVRALEDFLFEKLRR